VIINDDDDDNIIILIGNTIHIDYKIEHLYVTILSCLRYSKFRI